ncbi:MAG TPA: serine hydrolase domain-containing protein [Actinomycetota bacterium]|nr:serine hydrolase domain-containing protein [Actinomycetota bacterium]
MGGVEKQGPAVPGKKPASEILEGPDAKGRVWRIDGEPPKGSLKRFERGMKAFMSQNDFFGGTLAVVKDGRLVLARAYSLRHKSALLAEPIEVTSIFRIASMSKPITCVGIYRLLEANKLKLTDKIQDILQLEPPPDGSTIQQDNEPADPMTKGHYLHLVEVGHLMNHLGGWHPRGDGSVGEATFLKDVEIAQAFGHPLPVADPWEIARWGATQPMDFVPGKFVPGAADPDEWPYSNFGYLLLGLVLEKASGMPYETAVKKGIFDRINTSRPRLTQTLKENRNPGEVTYHLVPPDVGPSVMHEDGRDVPLQYGFENNRNFAGFGGWALAAVDHARFLAEIGKPENGLIDTPAEDLPVWAKETLTGGVTVFRHGGGIPGSQGDADCRSDGITFVAIFNCTLSGLGKPDNTFTFEGTTYDDHRPMWHDIANTIDPDDWPPQLDLFPRYFQRKVTLVPDPPRVVIPRLEQPRFAKIDFRENLGLKSPTRPRPN